MRPRPSPKQGPEAIHGKEGEQEMPVRELKSQGSMKLVAVSFQREKRPMDRRGVHPGGERWR